MQPCGHCGGSGKVPGPRVDRLGTIPDPKPWVWCEFCEGVGECVEGDKLLACTRKPITEADRLPNAGCPAWA